MLLVEDDPDGRIVSASADVAAIHPVPRTKQGAPADFLSGLVNHDGTMIALIDLPQLLSETDGVVPPAMPH